MLSPRLDATPIKRATLAASRLKTVVHFSFVCLQSLLHLEPGYSTPIANATAAAAKRIVCAIREETEEEKNPTCTTHRCHSTTQAPSSLLTALRDAAEPRASVKA